MKSNLAPALMMDAVVFDLGKVLLDWDPRYFYGQFFGTRTDELEAFVTHVVSPSWIQGMDAGRPSALAIRERQMEFPEHAELIGRWSEGWPQMLRGEIEGTAGIIRDLRKLGIRLHALTNFSTETFPVAKSRCPTLSAFESILVSGEVGLVKPDPRIFELATRQWALRPCRTLFVDDLPANVEAARRAGWHALQFHTPAKLECELRNAGLLQD